MSDNTDMPLEDEGIVNGWSRAERFARLPHFPFATAACPHYHRELKTPVYKCPVCGSQYHWASTDARRVDSFLSSRHSCMLCFGVNVEVRCFGLDNYASVHGWFGFRFLTSQLVSTRFALTAEVYGEMDYFRSKEFQHARIEVPRFALVDMLMDRDMNAQAEGLIELLTYAKGDGFGGGVCNDKPLHQFYKSPPIYFPT